MANQKIEKNIALALSFWQKKLNTSFSFVIEPLIIKDKEEDSSTLFAVSRSNRGQEDIGLFIIYYNEKNVEKMGLPEIKVNICHELLHVLSFNLYDCFENIFPYVKGSSALKQELFGRYLNAREQVVYGIERSMLRHLAPHLPWEES